MTDNKSQTQYAVLVVDDDPSIPMLIRASLERRISSLEVVTAANGREALDLLRRQRIDLLITDLDMPVMDGIVLLTHVMEEFPHIPTVVLTSLGSESQEYARRTGVTAVLSKPVDVLALPEMVSEWLERYRSHTLVERLRLSSFAQLIEMDRRTCALGVREMHSGRIGMLYFRQGKILDAFAGRLRGVDAALLMFTWSDVQVWMRDFVPEDMEARVQAPLQWLLLEAARLADEGGEDLERRSAQVPTPTEIRDERPSELTRRRTTDSDRSGSAPGDRAGMYQARSSPTSVPGKEASLSSLIDSATDAFRAGEYERAVELWKQASEIAPGNGMIRHNLAVALRCMEQQRGNGD